MKQPIYSTEKRLLFPQVRWYHEEFFTDVTGALHGIDNYIMPAFYFCQDQLFKVNSAQALINDKPDSLSIGLADRALSLGGHTREMFKHLTAAVESMKKAKKDLDSIMDFYNDSGDEFGLLHLSTVLKHKEYYAKMVYDDQAYIFHGEVIGLKDVITFQSKNIRDLPKEFKKSIDVYEQMKEEK